MIYQIYLWTFHVWKAQYFQIWSKFYLIFDSAHIWLGVEKYHDCILQNASAKAAVLAATDVTESGCILRVIIENMIYPVDVPVLKQVRTLNFYFDHE